MISTPPLTIMPSRYAATCTPLPSPRSSGRSSATARPSSAMSWVAASRLISSTPISSGVSPSRGSACASARNVTIATSCSGTIQLRRRPKRATRERRPAAPTRTSGPTASISSAASPMFSSDTPCAAASPAGLAKNPSGSPCAR
jgi:hypothetical protein